MAASNGLLSFDFQITTTYSTSKCLLLFPLCVWGDVRYLFCNVAVGATVYQPPAENDSACCFTFYVVADCVLCLDLFLLVPWAGLQSVIVA